MGTVSLKGDPELTRLYPQKWPSRVEIELRNGKRYRGYCEYPKGEPENPISERELIEKFNKLCGTMPKNERDRIIGLALNLEEVDDVTNIFQG